MGERRDEGPDGPRLSTGSWDVEGMCGPAARAQAVVVKDWHKYQVTASNGRMIRGVLDLEWQREVKATRKL